MFTQCDHLGLEAAAQLEHQLLIRRVGAVKSILFLISTARGG